MTQAPLVQDMYRVQAGTGDGGGQRGEFQGAGAMDGGAVVASGTAKGGVLVPGPVGLGVRIKESWGTA